MMSDQSDCEGRIQTLHRELHYRKAEIERLKREQSKKFAKDIQLGKELEVRFNEIKSFYIRSFYKFTDARVCQLA